MKDALDELYDDCIGQLLINAIGKKVSITTGYFGSSRVSPVVLNLPSGPVISGYEIMKGSRVDALSVMEELMHIYQGMGTMDYRSVAMNNEVEAKLLWYMYAENTGHRINSTTMLGREDAADNYGIMMGYLLQSDIENPGFIDTYANAVECLRNIKSYKDEDRYPFDPGKMDCKKLRESIENCLNQ